MLQFIFNQINQTSNNANNESIDEQKINKYQKKINKYNDKLQYMQLHETAGGSFSFGIKLFVFNDKDFSDIDRKNKYDFHSTDDLAKKIGEKSYIVELGSDKANIFLSNIQVIERKMKKMKKQNLFLSSDSLSLSNTLNDKNHKAIFEEIRKDIPSGNFNRYVLINFGMMKNSLIELSDVMKTNDTTLSETSATPDTYSSVQFNDSKVKSNTPFIKQEITSDSPTSSAPVPARPVSNLSTTSNSSDNINTNFITSSAPVPSVPPVSNLSTTSNSSDNNKSITSSAQVPPISNLSTTSNSSDDKITNPIKPSDNKPITAQPIKGNVRYYASSLNLLL
jgi:hypothetical protein